jgi:hypothetical protein
VDDVLAFLVALGRRWQSLMSGIAGVVLAGFAAATDVSPRVRPAFVVPAIVCVLVAAFFAWREEHRRNATDPRLFAERKRNFDHHIRTINTNQTFDLRQLARDGRAPRTTELAYFFQKTGILREEGETYRPANETYQRLLEKWLVDNEPIARRSGRRGMRW